MLLSRQDVLSRQKFALFLIEHIYVYMYNIYDNLLNYIYIERPTKLNSRNNVLLHIIERHLLPQFVNTIQSNLSTECIQSQFLFLKDCTSKHVGPIVSYN